MTIDETEDRRKHAKARTLEFFRALNVAEIVPALDRAKETWEIRDEVYRIFHQSWKMYGLSSIAVELAALMLSPLGWKPSDKDLHEPARLIAGMRRWYLDETFVDTFERTVATIWSDGRNPALLWREDARQLLAGAALVHEVALASLEAMQRMTCGEGFLFNAETTLDSTDALFLEVWTGLGDGLRYWHFKNKGLDAECRAILAERAKKAPDPGEGTAGPSRWKGGIVRPTKRPRPRRNH